MKSNILCTSSDLRLNKSSVIILLYLMARRKISFEHLFDALFHMEFCDTMNFRQQDVSREHSKALHAEYFAMGTKATLVHYRRVGFSTIDVSYNLFNDQDEVVTRQLITRQNGRIVRTQQVSYRNVALNTEENDGVKQQFFNISGTECSASS
jgi:hypothetical protein